MMVFVPTGPARVLYAPVNQVATRFSDIIIFDKDQVCDARYPWEDLGAIKTGFVQDLDMRSLEFGIVPMQLPTVINDLVDGFFSLVILWAARANSSSPAFCGALFEDVELLYVREVLDKCWPMTFAMGKPPVQLDEQLLEDLDLEEGQR